MFYLFVYNLEIFSAFWGLSTIYEKGSDELNVLKEIKKEK